MKTKIIAFLFLVLLLSGCGGLTRISIITETKKIDIWTGKEYKSFKLHYKKGKDGEEELHIEAKKVDAFEGQKIGKDVVVDVVKAAVKSAMPIP